MEDVRRVPPHVQYAIVKAASTTRADVQQFLTDTMDPDERPLVADQSPSAFFANLNAGAYDEL